MQSIEDASVEREAKRLRAIADGEIARLEALGWPHDEALLMVEASPAWPYAHEDDAPPGILPAADDARTP